MKVYLLKYDASYDGEPEGWINVYNSYDKAQKAMEKEIHQELMPSTWFGDLLKSEEDNEEDNIVQERGKNHFEIYKDGEWLLYHARYEIIEKEVL